MVLYKNKLSKANVAKTLEGIYEIYRARYYIRWKLAYHFNTP